MLMKVLKRVLLDTRLSKSTQVVQQYAPTPSYHEHASCHNVEHVPHCTSHLQMILLIHHK